MYNYARLALLLGAILIITMAVSVSAETELTYDGQIRIRDEAVNKSFDAERHTALFSDMRTRLGLKFEPTELVYAYIQFQDSRRLGDPSSGGLNSTNNVDLHQAYIVVNQFIWKHLALKGGRFELNYGNQRVFGAVGWSNIGRSWEGGMLSYAKDNFQIDFFGLKKMEMNDDGYNRDFDIGGIYAKFKQINLDLYLFGEIDADTSGYVQEKLQRFNLGTYYTRKFDAIDFTVQGLYQFGEMPQGTIPDSFIVDIAAFMFAAEVGYKLDGESNIRFAVGVDYTSGNDGTDSTKHKAFANEYYTGHKFRGYMDYFVASPNHGLIDLMLRGSGTIAPKWVVKGDFHYFKAAEEYVSLSDTTTLTTNIGIEVDLGVVHKASKGVTVIGGVSFFVADEHFVSAGDDRKTGLWSYLMTVVNF